MATPLKQPPVADIIARATALAIAGGQSVDALAPLIDQSPAVLNSQIQTSDAIGTWAHRTAAIFAQFKAQDAALRDLLKQGTSGIEESRVLLDRVTPALPVLFANLVSLGKKPVVLTGRAKALAPRPDSTPGTTRQAR